MSGSGGVKRPIKFRLSEMHSEHSELSVGCFFFTLRKVRFIANFTMETSVFLFFFWEKVGGIQGKRVHQAANRV